MRMRLSREYNIRMNGKWSLCWIILLFVALFLGPSLILQGPRRLVAGQTALHLTTEQEALLDVRDFRDAPISPSSLR